MRVSIVGQSMTPIAAVPLVFLHAGSVSLLQVARYQILASLAAVVVALVHVNRLGVVDVLVLHGLIAEDVKSRPIQVISLSLLLLLLLGDSPIVAGVATLGLFQIAASHTHRFYKAGFLKGRELLSRSSVISLIL